MTTHFLLLRAFASTRILAVVLLLAVAFVAGPASATVQLRVEGRPNSNPIKAYVRVSNASGAVQGLDETNFAVLLDGADFFPQAADLTLPPDENPGLRVSVVFVMDYTSSVTGNFLAEMEGSVIAFIDAMNVGDHAAIIKFNNDSLANVVHAFIDIDEGVNDDALKAAVTDPYPGDGSNILDATNLAVEHMTTELPGLPLGPKAIILVTDGIDSHSTSTPDEVIGAANGSGIPIFTIGVGNPNQNATDLLTSLATDTGGEFIPTADGPEIADAYLSVSELLKGEYLLTIPLAISDVIIGDDCAVHTMAVTVSPGHGSDSAAFTRRICDTVPEDFSFIDLINVPINSTITSDTITISGIAEAPADISIQIGSYSIGCDGTFTRDPDTITDGETVCVRHTSSAAGLTRNTTTLTIGGVSGTFSSTTRAAQGGGGGGGGGATGGVELLLGLVALMARRRRRV